MKEWVGAFLGILLFPFVLFTQETAGEDAFAEIDANLTEISEKEIANHIDAVKSAQPFQISPT